MSISEGSSPLSRAARGKAAKLLGLSAQEDQPGGEANSARRQLSSLDSESSSAEERSPLPTPSTARVVQSLKNIVDQLHLDVIFVNLDNNIHSGQPADLLRLFSQCLLHSDISPEGSNSPKTIPLRYCFRISFA
jgi:hypothetical protein